MMKHFSITIPGLLAVLVLAACSWIAGPDIEETVSVEAQDSTLVITNQSNVTIYYEVMIKEIFNLADWGPCVDPEECSSITIEPGTFKEIPYTDIYGYGLKPGDTNIVVMLWYLKKDLFSESGYQVGEMVRKDIVIPG